MVMEALATKIATLETKVCSDSKYSEHQSSQGSSNHNPKIDIIRLIAVWSSNTN